MISNIHDVLVYVHLYFSNYVQMMIQITIKTLMDEVFPDNDKICSHSGF